MENGAGQSRTERPDTIGMDKGSGQNLPKIVRYGTHREHRRIVAQNVSGSLSVYLFGPNCVRLSEITWFPSGCILAGLRQSVSVQQCTENRIGLMECPKTTAMGFSDTLSVRFWEDSAMTPIRDSLMIRVGKNPDVRPDFPHNEAEVHQFALILYTVLFLERLAGKIGLEGQLPEIMGVVNDVLADYELPAFFEIS